MWLDRDESPDEMALREILKSRKPPKDLIKAKLWYCVRQNKHKFPDVKSLREILNATKPPADPLKAKVWYYLRQEETESPLLLRDILNTTKPPKDPIKAERWNYLHSIIMLIMGAPAMALVAFATSAAAPGYEPLRRVGFGIWVARFFVINSHVNIWGWLGGVGTIAAVIGPYTLRRRQRRLRNPGD